MKYLVSGILLLIFANLSFMNEIKASEWETKKRDKKHDIQIYCRDTETGYVEFKAVTHLKCSLNSLIALLDDKETLPKWIDRTEKVEVLKNITDTESYVRSVNRMPFPFKNRDAIIHSIVEQDPHTFIVTIKGRGIPDYIPREKKYVRITKIESFWEFIPQPDGTIEVIFQGLGEPGGNIPSKVYKWLCRFFLWESIYKTFKQMRIFIFQEKYQNVTFPYIKESKYTKIN